MEQQIELVGVKDEYCPEDQTPLTVKQLQEYDSFTLQHEELDIKSEIIDGNEKAFTCADCSESFAYRELLDLHKTIHSVSVNQKNNCPCCSRTYVSIPHYKLHIQDHLTSYRRCTFCPKIFLNSQKLRTHISDHKHNREIVCEHCEKCFSHRGSLLRHLRVHVNGKSYKCDQCDMSFTTGDALKSHKKRHEETIKCPSCVESFSSKLSLRNHIKEVHVTKQLWNCLICNETFKNKVLLDQHNKQNHPVFNKKCQVCQEEFISYTEYFNHRSYCDHNDRPLLEGAKLKISGNNILKGDSAKLKPKIHKDKTFRCIECTETFEYGEFLALHRNIHEPVGEGRKSCPLCRASFHIMAEYAEHIQSHLKFYYRCTFCPKIFFLSTHFKKHIADHKRNGDLLCKYCGKSFTVQKSLDIHIRTHTNERPYKCNDCGRAFIQLTTLQYHKKQVHKEGKLLDCPKCSKQLPTRANLKNHIDRAHNDKSLHSCTECMKTFTMKELLEKHIMEHHLGLSAFYEICLVCKQEFFTRAEYIDHHHGNSDYSKEKQSRLSEEENKPMTDIAEVHTQEENSPKPKKVTCWLCGIKVIRDKYPDHKMDHMMFTEEELVALTEKGLYPCKKCDKVYASTEQLFEHMDCHATKHYKCSNNCDENFLFTYAGLKRHLLQCQLPSESNKIDKNILGCKWCPRSFKNTQRLLVHYRNHIDRTGYQCIECSRKFAQPAGVRLHIRLVHRKILSLQYCYEQLGSELKECKWCKVSFDTKIALEQHENLHKSNKHQCKECKTRFPRFATYMNHVSKKQCLKWIIEALVPEVKQLKCIFCEKISGNCILVTAHVLARHMKELYPCKFCGSSVALQSLRTHLIENHNSEKKYSCLGCDDSFVTLKAYVDHRKIYPKRPFSHNFTGGADLDAIQSASVSIDSDMTNDVRVKTKDDGIVDTVDSQMVIDVPVKVEEDDFVDTVDSDMTGNVLVKVEDDIVDTGDNDMLGDIPVKVEENDLVDTVDGDIRGNVPLNAEEDDIVDSDMMGNVPVNVGEDDIVDIPDILWVNDEEELAC